MLTETMNHTFVSSIETTSTVERSAPSWFGRVCVLMQWFWTSWMLMGVSASALAPIRRADATPPVDILMWMLVCAVGQMGPSQAQRELGPWAKVLAELWGRQRMPGRWALSRFLSASTEANVEQWRTLFLPLSVSLASGVMRWAASKIDVERGFFVSTLTGLVRRSCNEVYLEPRRTFLVSDEQALRPHRGIRVVYVETAFAHA
jgi:hypothetical protein